MNNKRTKADLCYMCEKLGETIEHIPPRCFFPKKQEFRKNLITVPSCHEHNTEKSGEDEYMRILFVGITAHGLDADLTKSTMKSISRKKRLALEIAEKSLMRSGYTIDECRISSYLACIARGIYLEAFGERFTGELNILTHFLDEFTTDRDLRKQDIKARRNFMWRRLFATRPLLPELPWAGENSDIFRYRIYRSNAGGMLEMEFYRTHRVDGLFTAEVAD